MTPTPNAIESPLHQHNSLPRKFGTSSEYHCLPRQRRAKVSMSRPQSVMCLGVMVFWHGASAVQFRKKMETPPEAPPQPLADFGITIHFNQQLGSGLDGDVHSCMSTAKDENNYNTKSENLKELAVKIIRSSDLAKKNPDHVERLLIKSITKEAATLAKFNASNIVQLHSVYVKELGQEPVKLDIEDLATYTGMIDTVYIVMTRYDNDLGHVYSPKQPRDENMPMVAKHFGQIAAAIASMHKLRIMHRDVKPENVLLDSAGNAVLADFGFALQVPEPSGIYEHKESHKFGAYGYASPQIVRNESYSGKTDVWSLGILLLRMITGVVMTWNWSDSKTASFWPVVKIGSDLSLIGSPMAWWQRNKDTIKFKHFSTFFKVSEGGKDGWKEQLGKNAGKDDPVFNDEYLEKKWKERAQKIQKSLSDILDEWPEVQILLAGLLAQEEEHRWTAKQVSDFVKQVWLPAADKGQSSILLPKQEEDSGTPETVPEQLRPQSTPRGFLARCFARIGLLCGEEKLKTKVSDFVEQV